MNLPLPAIIRPTTSARFIDGRRPTSSADHRRPDGDHRRRQRIGGRRGAYRSPTGKNGTATSATLAPSVGNLSTRLEPGHPYGAGGYPTNADTDDRHKANAFERMGRVLDMRPDVALVYADVRGNSRRKPEPSTAAPRPGSCDWHDWSRDTLLTQGCFIGPQPMWRRCVHEEYGFSDETPGLLRRFRILAADFPDRLIPPHRAARALPVPARQRRARQLDLKALEDARTLLSAYRRAARDGAISSPHPRSRPENRMAGPNLA